MPQNKILVVTFTRAAADQMRERYLRACAAAATDVTFGTFHGIFYAILRRSCGISGGSLLTGEKKLRLLTDVLAMQGVKGEQPRLQAEALEREISCLKSGAVSWETFQPESVDKADFPGVYARYRDILLARGLLDFDDLLLNALQLFQAQPQLLAYWQGRFSHILVDEVQDIDATQYALLKLLALPENNLFLVGDDDQSIYGFRGSRPELLLRMPKDIPGLQTVFLGENYRCGKKIVEVSSKLIGKNKKRYDKTLRAAGSPDGSVEVFCCQDRGEELQRLLCRVQEELCRGIPAREIAVLTRTNGNIRAVLSLFTEREIPFCSREKIPDLSGHFIWKDLESYLLLASGKRDRALFFRILNKPERYLSRMLFTESQVDLKMLAGRQNQSEWIREKLYFLDRDLRMLSALPPYAAIHYIRYAMGYGGYLEKYAADKGIDGGRLMEILGMIEQMAAGTKTLEELQLKIEKYNEKKTQMEQREDKNGIWVGTLHGAKGLEFSAVHIPDVNEGTIPWHQAVSETALEEERRMFYVGLTRAKSRLSLYYLEDDGTGERCPSRFLAEMELL